MLCACFVVKNVKSYDLICMLWGFPCSICFFGAEVHAWCEVVISWMSSALSVWCAAVLSL